MFQPMRGSIVLQNINPPENSLIYRLIRKRGIKKVTRKVSRAGVSDGNINFGLVEISLAFGTEQISKSYC